MNRLTIGSLIALPVLISFLPLQASAADLFRQDHTNSNYLIARVHQKLIPGHWEGRGRYRHWVKAHYVRV